MNKTSRQFEGLLARYFEKLLRDVPTFAAARAGLRSGLPFQYTFRKFEGRMFSSVRYLATVRRAMTIPFSFSILTTS